MSSQSHTTQRQANPEGYWKDADDLRWAARHWAARIGVRLRSLHLRPMTKKWASVSTGGRLTLDTTLLELPRDLGEFVIVHELVHLLNPDARHGRVFKSFMHAYLPGWEEKLRRLDAWSQSQYKRTIAAHSPQVKRE